ncbi:MAG: lamin tail domain-containing protein [Phaeodactylibacter sp.]|nr:lamin tail domain-containing protein [Phaeodactylibacter sp.]
MKNLLLKQLFLLCLFLPLGASAQLSDLIISEYGEGSGNNKYMEIYNGTGQAVDLSNYVMWKIINEGNWWERDFPMGGILEDGETYLMVNPDADPALLEQADTVGPVSPTFFLFNGNEAFALCKILAPGDTVIIDVIGVESGDVVPENWDVAGVVGAGTEHTWVRKPTVCDPNPVWASSAGANAEDSEWIVYEQDYWENVGQHSHTCSGGLAEDLFICEYGEGSSNNKYMEIYNGTGEDVDLSNYVMWKIINEGNWWERDFPMSGTLPNGETYLMVNPDADPVLLEQADTVGPVSPTFFLFNGNEAFALCKIMGPGDTVIIDVIGVESGDMVPENWDVAGVIGAGAEHTWVRKPNVCKPNPAWPASAGTNAEDSEWIVYDQDYWEDVGQHTMDCDQVITPTVNVTFRVDMSQETVAPEGVHLAGSFQNWMPGDTPMADDDGDGVWELTLMLEVNQTYEFKYVNGDQWGDDESVPPACALNQNRFVEVAEEAIVLDVVCFSSCSSCSGLYNVTFRVDMSEQDVSPDGVHIAGNFQGWVPDATPMADDDGDGVWEYTTQLGGNTSYQYKFINGKNWGFDEAVPAGCAQDNNRVIEVGTSDITTTAFCFGSCVECEGNAVIDFQLMSSLLVYPNPNDGRFTASFDLPEHREITINVYNPMGQLLTTQSQAFHTGHHTVALEVEAKGLLFVEFAGSRGKAYRRVVVQ